MFGVAPGHRLYECGTTWDRCAPWFRTLLSTLGRDSARTLEASGPRSRSARPCGRILPTFLLLTRSRTLHPAQDLSMPACVIAGKGWRLQTTKHVPECAPNTKRRLAATDDLRPGTCRRCSTEYSICASSTTEEVCETMSRMKADGSGDWCPRCCI